MLQVIFFLIIHRLLCLCCEKTFKTPVLLREHMRKKQHRSLNPKNKMYDKFYLLNYLEVRFSFTLFSSVFLFYFFFLLFFLSFFFLQFLIIFHHFSILVSFIYFMPFFKTNLFFVLFFVLSHYPICQFTIDRMLWLFCIVIIKINYSYS